MVVKQMSYKKHKHN